MKGAALSRGENHEEQSKRKNNQRRQDRFHKLSNWGIAVVVRGNRDFDKEGA